MARRFALLLVLVTVHVVVGHRAAVAGSPGSGGKRIEGVVNVNTASPDMLALLPGVGPAKVQTIVAYRQRRPFRTIDELVRVRGISSKMIKRLRPHLSVSGPSTARRATGRPTQAGDLADDRAPTPAPPPLRVIPPPATKPSAERGRPAARGNGCPPAP